MPPEPDPGERAGERADAGRKSGPQTTWKDVFAECWKEEPVSRMLALGGCNADPRWFDVPKSPVLTIPRHLEPALRRAV